MMKGQWAVVPSLIIALVVGLATGAAAADAKGFTLMGQRDTPEASGTATLAGKKLTITAKGLKPDAVYSVWFVNMGATMTKAGVGKAPYSFKTDGKGNAKYTATLDGSPEGKWQSIMIVRHPTGDPKDMDHMEDALMAKLM